eukprot:scaffold36039_cov88-Phaeocystis_antarctica.AAC.1
MCAGVSRLCSPAWARRGSQAFSYWCSAPSRWDYAPCSPWHETHSLQRGGGICVAWHGTHFAAR